MLLTPVLGVFEPVAVLFLVLIIGGGLLTMVILYLLTLQNTLKACRPENRQTDPSNVWLMFIPFFNIIWPFILYPKIADSVKLELESRGHREEGDYGKTLGILIPAFQLGGIIPLLGFLTAPAAFIMWILFWVKMSGYKNLIQSLPVELSTVEARPYMANNPDLLDTI